MEIDFNDLEINDEQLEIMFNRIKEKNKVIELDLSDNDFTKLPDSISEFTNLERLDLQYCKKLKSLGELEEIDRSLDLSFCENLESLGKLERVKGDLYLLNCYSLKNLGNLKEIGGELWLNYNSPITPEFVKKNYPQFYEQIILDIDF